VLIGVDKVKALFFEWARYYLPQCVLEEYWQLDTLSLIYYQLLIRSRVYDIIGGRVSYFSIACTNV